MARVIIAEDEKNIRTFVSEALKLDDHDVTEVENGRLAIKEFERGTFDVLITDLKMPQVDGLALAEYVRRNAPNTQLIVVTAYGSVNTAVEAMKMGAIDYLQKPVKLSDLRALVKRAEIRAKLRLPDVGADVEDIQGIELSWGDPVMTQVTRVIARIAPTTASVLIYGESGVGKDVVARTIHEASPRRDRPFVAVNCAAISETLSESEFFGHEKGAFTGATDTRVGMIEEADGGTLFLDELGSLHPQLQAKLLRVLESNTYRRVGSSTTRKADVRWVAATNQNLRHMVEIGTFRKDLYHRLAVFPILIPPLRERMGDLEPLANLLAAKVGDSMGLEAVSIQPKALTMLKKQKWPGNVRELKNTIERACILADSTMLTVEHFDTARAVANIDATLERLEGDIQDDQIYDLSLFELEKRAVTHALETFDTKVAAAEHLGIPVRSLYNKITRFEIK